MLIYSLDSTLVFDPFEFGLEVTPEVMKGALAKGEYSLALLLALRLNVTELIQEALESTPLDQGRGCSRIGGYASCVIIYCVITV